MEHTREEIALDFELWGQYVDAWGITTRQEFDDMSLEKKLAIQEECFGPEEDDQE